MATVKDMLDRLHTGAATLDQVAADFRTRKWPTEPEPAPDAAWGESGDDMPGMADPDSFDCVQADSRLTPDQYAILAGARATATRGAPCG